MFNQGCPQNDLSHLLWGNARFLASSSSVQFEVDRELLGNGLQIAVQRYQGLQVQRLLLG